MNKIVRTQGPASDLPERYRAGIAPSQKVQVTVEEIAEIHASRSITEILRKVPGGDVTANDAVARIRKLRDEWPE
jgi:hypothetical protein